MAERQGMSTAWGVVTAALLVFLLLVMLERAFAMVFVLNFTTAGPGPTLFLVLLLLSGFLYPLGLHKQWPHAPRSLDLSVVASTNLVFVSLFPAPALAATAALLAWLVATPLLFALTARLGARIAEGLALGLLLHLAGRAWLNTAPFGATGSGWAWVLVVGIALFAVWMLYTRTLFEAPVPVPRPHTLAPFLILIYAFLGSPAVIASWSGMALLPTWGAVIIGVGLGITALRLPFTYRPGAITGTALLLAFTLFDLVAVGAFPLLSTSLALGASIHLVGADTAGIPVRTLRETGIKTGILQTVALVAVFLHATAPSWAFMPEPVGNIVHGRAHAWLFAIGVLLALIALVQPILHRRALERPRVPRLLEPPYAGAIAIAVALSLGGLWVHEGPPASPLDDGPPLIVATYNIHQYFSTGQTGHYNLEAVARVIEESDADIIGLQESEGARITSGNLDGVRWLAHRLDMYFYHGPPASESLYGIALLSKYPLLDSAWASLPAQQSVERAAIVVLVDVPFGPIPVLVTHLQTEEHNEDRMAQVEAITRLTEPLSRAVLLGDFNTPPDIDDAAYRLLSQNYQDAWIAAGHPRESGATELDAEDPQRIDHVWLLGGWAVHGCDVYGGPIASDHRLVACSITPSEWADPDL